MAKNSIFNTVKMSKPNKSVFDLSHDVKLSCNMGALVPTCCIECIPGDKFNIGCESLIRFAPLVAPVMHRMDVTMHYFFVPLRLLWQNWQFYITQGGSNPITPPVSMPAFPFVNISVANYVDLTDYLGIPVPIGAEVEKVSAMPFAVYQKIYEEYYRDQNMIATVASSDPTAPMLSDGDNTAWHNGIGGGGSIKQRAWEHDYFTSALPWTQKGDVVSLPLGSGTVMFNPLAAVADPTWKELDGTLADAGVVNQGTDEIFITGNPTDVLGYDPRGTLELDIDSTNINDLRQAFRLQEWLEKNARGGTRYIENILMHFGVRSSDKRLQRPEYITGTKSAVVISEVLNTTGTEDAAQGDMAGHGVSVTSGQYGNYYCEEHGYIMGIMSVMPKTAYQQGIAKHWLKINDPTELAWPTFAHLGEQPVLHKELYAFQGTAGEETFGYVPRYAEYKFENNRVAGDFRNTLNFWHLGRIFTAPPALNQEFIEADPTFRIFADTQEDVDHLWCHIYHKIKVVRALPKFGTPSF